MTNSKGRGPDSLFVRNLRAWQKREADLLAGAVIPTLHDRYAGHSPFKGSALLDLRQLVDLEVERDQLPEPVLKALKKCATTPTGSQCFRVSKLAGAHDGDLSSSLLWHAAIRGHMPACQEIIEDTLFDRRPHDEAGWVSMAGFALGLLSHARLFDPDIGDGSAIDAFDAREKGFDKLRQFGGLIADRQAALAEINRDVDEPAIVEGMQSALAAMKAQQKPAPEPVDEIPDFGPPPVATLLVAPGDPALKPSGAKADVFKAFKHVIGKPLRLVGIDNLASARTELHRRHPHMHAELDRILGTQVSLQHARFNVLLVSEPGLGKTTVARDIAETMALPQITYGCAGIADAMFGGTSAGWSSARASVPLQLIARSRTANPCVILDEIDKIGTGKHNGSLADVLLGFLERSSSQALHDLALEMDVDLSAVSYIATANRLEDVPAALRDRFTVVRIPAPGWQHIGVLSERILDDLATERGLDRRWLEPLAEDEVDVVKATWPGGSLRRLQRAVRLLVDGREQLMGRA